MNLEERRLVDQALVSEEQCLGAVFCSYTFDPAYFEDQVLRAILRLGSDPDEDGARYHEEARAALRETPVACLVDASVRRGGRRLPYDLLLVRERVFHPKVTLVLYESEARLAVGSGNMTKAGIEQNTELFFVRTLRYQEPADAALLREVDAFLASCVDLARSPSAQIDLVRQALAARIAGTRPLRDGERVDARFVSSFGGSLLREIAAGIPEDSRITRIGVLAPFFERDDLAAGDETVGMTSVLGELLGLRASKDATLDIGVPWDDAPLGPPPSAEPPPIEDHLGALWARRFRDGSAGGASEHIEHFVVERVTAKRVELRTPAGGTRRIERAVFEASVSEGAAWPVARPTVHAPKRILTKLAEERAVRLWLHPSAELGPSGRARRRPLHAKLFLVTVSQRGRSWTHVLAGSANASRGAMLRGVVEGGNVEAGVSCRLEGEVTLQDVLPSLVEYSLNRVTLEEREMGPSELDLSAWIEEVVHDARARTLSVVWRDSGPSALGEWSIRYLDRELGRGRGRPETTTDIGSFDLAAASAEVMFASGGGEWSIPIRVADLADLPIHPQLAGLGLRELLALLGRRVSAERISTLLGTRGPSGVATALEAVFGEGFGPTDVFKAWWGITEDLSAAPTVPAFRHGLFGPAGARTVWERLMGSPREEVGEDEVWVYGCELLRQLRKVVIPEGPDFAAKRALMAELTSGLTEDLERLTPEGGSRPWLSAVSRFYGVGGRDGSA